VKKIFQQLPEEERRKLGKRKQPSWTDPMLATLTDKRFSDKGWIYERKFDGERCLAFRKGRGVRLLSRNKKGLNDTYPELVDALKKQKSTDFVVDGEIVAFKGNVTSFERLQQRMKTKDPEEARKSRVAVFFYIFDLVYLEGRDTARLSLESRKRLLKDALSFSDPLRFVIHRRENGEAYYREACKKGWEGVIAKDAGSQYIHSRSKSWLKFKCVNRQELVIGGYTDPEGERIGFGALLVGYYERRDLKYAGKVGTGYDDETLRSLKSRLQSLKRKTPPFRGGRLPRKGIHWVTPKLVGQFGFTEWTNDGKLRHPRFLGLRRDKDPEDVVRERPRG
jgi:bifunctional non-homologous end joining protein LigD